MMFQSAFTRIFIIFLIFALKHRFLAPVRTTLLNTRYLWFEHKKNPQNFSSENRDFLSR